MDIATFRITKSRMLDKLPTNLHTTIDEHIALTLKLLDQETMSREALATIIALCTKELI